MTLLEFHKRHAEDHDAKVRLNGEPVECYSPKYLKRTYPQGGCRVVGEVTGQSYKKAVGAIRLGKEPLDVVSSGYHGGIMWKTVGYLRVGEDEYIALLQSRYPFFLLLSILLALVLILGGMLLANLLPSRLGYVPGETPGSFTPVEPGKPGSSSTPMEPGKPDGPIVIDPDHPLPPADEHAKPIEGDKTDKNDAPKGGGSVSMVYTLEAKLQLSTGETEIYFQNPNASSHNVVVELILVSDGKEYPIARSGLVEPGFALYRLDKAEDTAGLKEGIYTGLYRLQCYDPLTGERALVSPEIAGVEVTVVN